MHHDPPCPRVLRPLAASLVLLSAAAAPVQDEATEAIRDDEATARVDHLSIYTQYSERVTMTYFPAGHMMYIQKDSLARLKQEVAAFYARTLGR